MSAPSADQLHLRQATPAEKLLCWHRNAASWRGILSSAPISAYIERETINSLSLATRDGGIKYWILTTILNPPAEGEESADAIVASCETLKKQVLIADVGGGGGDGKEEEVREETAYGIASVYTDPKWRGRGYARVMMEKLGEWFDGEGCSVSVLWSDIGKVFYAQRGGWQPHPSFELSITITPAATATAAADVKLLRRDDVKALCEADCAALRTKFTAAGVGGPRVVFLPTYALADWHFRNEEHTGRVVRQQAPEVKGATAGGASMYWIHDFKDERLVALHVIGEVQEELGKAFEAAVQEARSWGFKEVVAWNPSDETLEGARRAAGAAAAVECREREMDSICSLRWKAKAEPKGVKWWENEKYCWC